MVHSNSQLVAAPWIALATALLFVAHPIQTQAVTYIVQRFASLVTLFYLLTVVCYLKWRLASQEARNRYLWYGGAVLCTVLAMKTKENSFTLPFMILLVEVVFFRPFTKKRWVTLIPFLLTLLIIPISRGDALGEAEGFARDTATISRSDYLFTQFRVIVTYLRLLVFPVNQNLDYDYPIYHSLLEPTVLVSFLFFLSLFSLGLYLLFNSQLKTHYSQLVSFGILWFFLALSIESSIIPITDVIFEHRLYLPSVGFFLVMILGMKKGLEGLGRRGVREGIPFILVLASLSIATFQRNVVWKDGVSLWKDVMEKSPNKARGHENLGVAYKEAGLLDLAIHQYREALRLQPEYPQAYNDLGIAYTEKNLVDDAKSAFYKALELWPNSSKAHNNLGAVYKKQGILDKAISEYQQAIKLDPDFADAHNNLGVVYVERGLLKEGITEYRKAIKLKPVPEIYYNLATALELSGEKQEAIEHYQQFIELAPEKYHLHVKKAKNRSDELRENYTPISK